MRTCNTEIQKRSEKSTNFKEDDRSLPLQKFLLYGSATIIYLKSVVSSVSEYLNATQYTCSTENNLKSTNLY